LHWQFIFQYDTHTAHETGLLLVSCSVELAVDSCLFFSLQRHGCEIFERIYSIVRLYCVTITWQQTVKGSLQETVEAILPHVTVGRRYFGGKLNETMTGDSVKERSFIPELPNLGYMYP